MVSRDVGPEKRKLMPKYVETPGTAKTLFSMATRRAVARIYAFKLMRPLHGHSEQHSPRDLEQRAQTIPAAEAAASRKGPCEIGPVCTVDPAESFALCFGQ